VQVTACVFPFQITNAIKKHYQTQNAFTRSFTKHQDTQNYQRNQRRRIPLQKEKRAQLVNITQMMCNKQHIICNNLGLKNKYKHILISKPYPTKIEKYTLILSEFPITQIYHRL